MYPSGEFCRTKTPSSILLSPGQEHSNHHTSTTPHQQICTCHSHHSLVCHPGSKRIVCPDVAICLSIHTCPTSELCVPTSHLPPPSSQSHTCQNFIPSIDVFSSQPSAARPSHPPKASTALSPEHGRAVSPLFTYRCSWPLQKWPSASVTC